MDELPEAELKAAQRFLEYLRDIRACQEISVTNKGSSAGGHNSRYREIRRGLG